MHKQGLKKEYTLH